MKRVIRNKVFETNSSSSHSFSIMKKRVDDLTPPKTIYFELHVFSWYPEDCDRMDTLQGRANYLYACAVTFDKIEELKNALKQTLKDTNFVFEVFDKEEQWCSYIDHQSQEQACELLNLLIDDSDLLWNYLLDDNTIVNVVGDSFECELPKNEDRINIDWGFYRGVL